jgi:hypothetical protein
MSTVKANAIIDASGGNTATINSMTPTADSLQGFRNRIINGDMRIDQRNAGASVSTTGSYPVDRFYVSEGTSATFTSQRSTTAPVGYTNSLLFTVGTGASAGAAEQVQIRQAIEGFNIADLVWGTANAKSVTISFQVRSSITGTYCIFLGSSDGGVSYVATYSINSANTFETKSVTIAGPTTGTFNTDNSTGLLVGWDLGSGSNFNTTAGSWTSGQYRRTTSQANFISNSGATWYITGVQLEVGSVATPFERRDYGRELILCQRYFQSFGNGVNGTTGDSCIGTGMFYTASEIIVTAQFLVIMRAVPTFSCTTVTNGFRYHRAGANTRVNTLTYSGSSSTSAAIFGDLSVPVSGTAGFATQIYAELSGAKINFSAEL